MQTSVRKQPLQARAIATCAAICEAAIQVLLTKGEAGFNTNSISERAGVSVGTLYQYYPSKTAILAELVRDFRAGMLNDLRQGACACQHLDRDQAIRTMISAALDHHRRNPELAEALERAEASLPMDDETEVLKQQIFDLTKSLLHKHNVARPDIAARDLTAIIKGMAEAATRSGEQTFGDLENRITRTALGYLANDS